MTFEMQGQEEDFGSKCAGGADKSSTDLLCPSTYTVQGPDIQKKW